MKARAWVMARVLRGVLGVLLLIAAPAMAKAESLWGMEGIGFWQEGYDLAARGAGSTAIGVTAPFMMSPVNPAGTAFARTPQAHFAVLNENRWIRSSESDASDRRGSFRLLSPRVVIPGPGPMRWALGYREVTDASYAVEFTGNPGRPDEFRRTLTGGGGLGEFSATAAVTLLADRLAAGAQFGVLTGTLRDEMEDVYTGSGFRDLRNVLRTRLENGRTWSAGVQAQPLEGLGVGAVYHGAAELDLESIFEATNGEEWRRRAAYDLPAGHGLGLSYALSRRLRVAADWNHRAWSDAGFRAHLGGDPIRERGMDDTDRYGVGVSWSPGERSPRDPVMRRAVWRAGFSTGNLPIRQWDARAARPGASVSEWAATAGVGLPVQVDRGYLNGVLEVGRTGNLDTVGLRETFIRFGLGVTVGSFASAF